MPVTSRLVMGNISHQDIPADLIVRVEGLRTEKVQMLKSAALLLVPGTAGPPMLPLFPVVPMVST